MQFIKTLTNQYTQFNETHVNQLYLLEATIEAILIAYGLQKFIDGSLSTPPATTTVNETSTPNPEYLTWLRQDKLIFGALVGTISPPLIPLITLCATSRG